MRPQTTKVEAKQRNNDNRVLNQTTKMMTTLETMAVHQRTTDNKNWRTAKMYLLVNIAIVLASTLVSCLPVKLVADFPSFALNMLGGPAEVQHPEQQIPNLLVTSSSSSTSYLYRNPISADDDSDDLVEAAFVANPKGANLDYAEQVVDSILAGTSGNSNNDSTTTSSNNVTQASGSEKTGDSQSTKHNNTNSTLSRFMISNLGRKSNIIRLPNGQSFHICDEHDDLKCDDENAVCELGACVCRDGFFANRQSGLCQSISDMLKNCENDLHCQAFNVDLVCDTKSHERPFCDCTDGLYFDQETHTCLPCHRNTWLVHTGNVIKEADQMLWLANTSMDSLAPLSSTNNNTNVAVHVNDSQQPPAPALSPSTQPTPPAQVTLTSSDKPMQLRPCRPIDLVRLSSRRRQQVGLTHYSSNFEQMFRGSSSASSSSSPSGASATTSTTTTSHLVASSDPFRIKVPLEVFMGAIILFTFFTVAWFLLQRMIHDCRFKILRSLHNPDFTGASYPELQSSFAGSTTLTGCPGLGPGGGIARTRSTNHLYFDPTSQTVARLFTATDRACNNSSAGLGAYSAHLPFAGGYQRDLAGIMVQHFAANLSPSSTSQALALGPNGSIATRNLLSGQNDHEAALYPLAASAQHHQSRTAAAAAAAQLLLSPTHPAIAILRAAAASAAHSPGTDYNSANLLCSMFDPPPKYEEAVAQQAALQQQLNLAPEYTPEILPNLSSDQEQQTLADDPSIIAESVTFTNANERAEASEQETADTTTPVDQANTQRRSSEAGNNIVGVGDTSLPAANSVGSLLNICVSPIEGPPQHEQQQQQQPSDDLPVLVASDQASNLAQNPILGQRGDCYPTGSQQRGPQTTNQNVETQNQQRRQNSITKRVSRRSRKGRGSLSWSQQRHQKQQQQQQQPTQDSDDNSEV